MDNFGLERVTCGAPLIDKNKSGSGDPGVEDRSTMDSHPKRARRVDKGKAMALHEAGRDNRWIADDIGLYEGTVRRALKGVKEENREKD